MNEKEQSFRDKCIEHLKLNNDDNNKALQTLLRRSEICIIHTNSYKRGNVWNQRSVNIELRAPIPLFKEAKEYQGELHRLFTETYPATDQYAYDSLKIKPLMFGEDDVAYKEYDVVFDNIKQTIIQGIRDAKYTIWVAVAWFSNTDIFEELCKRKGDGVNIRILTIGNNSNKSLLEKLKKEFDTETIVLPGGHIFHHKFCIIDLEYVMHGSFNWSKNAEGNEETWSTALDRDFATKFADKFMRMYTTHKVDAEDIKCENEADSSDKDDMEDNF